MPSCYISLSCQECGILFSFSTLQHQSSCKNMEVEQKEHRQWERKQGPLRLLCDLLPNMSLPMPQSLHPKNWNFYSPTDHCIQWNQIQWVRCLAKSRYSMLGSVSTVTLLWVPTPVTLPLHQFPGTDNACLIKLLATLKIFGIATKLTNRDLERSIQGSH